MEMYIEFYASLMKYLPPGNSRFRREIKVEESLKLNRLIERYHILPEEAHLVLVNGIFIHLRVKTLVAGAVDSRLVIHDLAVQSNRSTRYQRSRAFYAIPIHFKAGWKIICAICNYIKLLNYFQGIR